MDPQAPRPAPEAALRQVLDEYAAEPLLAPLAAGSPLVPPCGPLDSPLVLIGEAPGEEETRQLRPFAGPAGRVLDQLLAEAGLDRRLIYLTNVVKYRPPGNRTPYPYEILSSRPCLQAEIELVRPVMVVTLGATALRAMTAFFEGTPEAALAEMEGKRLTCRRAVPDAHSYGLVPLYHPAYTFHNPGARARILAGLKSITGSDRAD